MRGRPAALVAALALAGCGGSAPVVSTTPAPAATPSRPGPSGSPLGASTPVDAVQALTPTGGPTICRPSTGPRFAQDAGCPVTARLGQRLQSEAAAGPGGGADPICRCQNVAPVSLSVAADSGGTATVTATFQLQPPRVVRFTVVQQGQGSGWLVDDTHCTDSSTSIYASPVRPCT